MSLAMRCSQSFESSARSRGGSYFHAGHVRIVDRAAQRATALVQGSESEPYEVRLEWSQAQRGAVNATCNCLRYDDGFLCKHIWATLLAVDAQGLSRNLPSHIRLTVVHQDDEADEDLDEGRAKDLDELEEAFSPVEYLRRGGRVETLRDLLRMKEAVPFQLRPQPPKIDWRRQVPDAAPPNADVPAGPRGDWTQVLDKSREAWFLLNVGESLSRGKLVIDFCQREMRTTGEFGKIKRLSLRRNEPVAFADPRDGWLLQCLLGNDAQGDAFSSTNFYNASYHDSQTFSRSIVAPVMYEHLLPQLCATGRFVWLINTGLPVEDGRRLTWDAGPPWRFRLVAQPDDARKQWRLSGQLYRDEQTAALHDAVLLLAHGIVLFPDRLARLDAQRDFPWIAVLRRSPTIEVPYRDRDELLQRLWSRASPPDMVLPDTLKLEPVRLAPQGKLSVKPVARHSTSSQLLADVGFVYGDQTVSLREPRAAVVDLENNRVLIRAPEAESTLLNRLTQFGVKPLGYYYRAQDDAQFPKRALPELVRRLTEEDWIVESEGQRIRRAGTFNLSVTSGIDWFELAGTIDFDGLTASLPQVLAALRNNQKYIRLDDGSQGMLPEEWLRRYGGLARLGHADGAAVKFAPSQALLLDALLSAQEARDRVQVDEQFAVFRQKLRSFDGIQPGQAPASFCGALRPYQQDGLGWLHFLRDFRFGGCLADDMGLGKTVQVLALLEARRGHDLTDGQPRKPSIVVVPKSLVFNWIDEAARFTPGLRVVNYTGLRRGELLEDLDRCDLLVTTYGTLRRDIVTLRDVAFDYAILDESQAVKNANSQAAKACRLLNADHRLAMTGTPIENHLGELWSLFEFLNPGMLGQSTAFTALTKTGRSEEENALPLLAKALRPFLLRRTKEQVLKELPEKTEQTLYCEMEPKQRKLYDSLRDFYRASLTKKMQDVGLKRAKIHVLEALLRLRQAACHPGLIDTKKASEPSAKLDLLLEQIEEVLAEGHKALVFSQFTSLLAIVRQRLDKHKIVYEYLDGQTQDRKTPVTRFQEDPACPLFLISLKAGGHGLNLTAADYVFILDPWWNPAAEAQAVDRAHRIGQTRRVFAYRLICRDTVEDKILELQRSKRELADALVSADNSLIRNLTAEDLQLLLS